MPLVGWPKEMRWIGGRKTSSFQSREDRTGLLPNGKTSVFRQVSPPADCRTSSTTSRAEDHLSSPRSLDILDHHHHHHLSSLSGTFPVDYCCGSTTTKAKRPRKSHTTQVDFTTFLLIQCYVSQEQRVQEGCFRRSK
jgi:hypothetical protein